jgi:hypothetical protein
VTRAAARRRRLAAPPARRLAALSLAAAGLSACWTGSAAPPATAAAAAPDPAAPCPTRLVGIVRNADTQAPLAGATVVVETAAGSAAAELTDGSGRFEAPAVRPPARLRIYYGERAVEHKLAACQPPLRIGVHL